ncbi:GILT-like protein 1 [Anthonomus grandis grandis]|uniref:GILT-like protein 1 n=1 Tax=Anthonomus grandis grandis TaxID=2921223 RepID=UPI0021655BF1|nr:GILT-like protein 1 [Anthonomus grandis grandis]
MLSQKLMLFVIVFATFYALFAYGQKVDISLYFEALCPDSLNFIINQLHPNWEDIKDHVNIKFIPFGKSHSLEGGTRFVCQHGSKECKGNRIMSCALHRIPDQTLQVQYLRCFMDVYKNVVFSDNENGSKCAVLLNLDSTDITENCYNTKEGTKLQLQAEIDTNTVGPKFVPTIVYNGVFDQRLQDRSLSNFRDVVCGLISQYDSQGCSRRTLISI